MSVRPRTLALLELAVLVLVALWALVFQLRLPGRLPTEDAYGRLAAALKAQVEPGDALLLVPWWTERARRFAPDGLPVLGYLGSYDDPFFAHPRLWVLSQPDLPRPDQEAFRAAFLDGRAPLGPAQRFGHLELRLYRNGRHRPVRFSAVEAYASARVYLEGAGGQRRVCPFDGRAHRCPGGAHLSVAPEWHELRFEPRRCLWMHPPGGAERLIAELDGVPGGTRLRLEGGIIWEHAAARAPRLTATALRVEAGPEAEALEIVVPPGLEGVQKAETSLGRPGSTHTVRISVQAANPESRQVCLDVLALGDES